MNTLHIANALCKLHREWACGLNPRNYEKPQQFLDALTSGFSKDQTVQGLVAELVRRRSAWDWK